MQHLKYLIWLTFVVALSSPAQGQAQEAAVEPIYMRIGDQLVRWTLDDGDQLVTTLPPGFESLSLSPSEDYALYETRSTQVQAECSSGGCAGPSKFPTEFYLIDLNTGEVTPFAGPIKGGDETGRSTPVWSPDGTQLAWTEGYDYGTLVVHDFTTGQRRALAEDIITNEVPGVSAVVPIEAWVDAGIVFKRTIAGPDDQPQRYSYHVYDPTTGTLRTEIPPLQRTAPGEYIARFEGADYVMTDLQTANLATGAVMTTSGGTIYTVAASSAEESLRIAPGIVEGSEWTFGVWWPDDDLWFTLRDDAYRVSPSGSAILELSTNLQTFTLWVRGQAPQTLHLEQQPDQIIWGRTIHLFVPNSSASFIAGARCQGSELAFRLRSGAGRNMGYVLGDTPNNLRIRPNRDAALVTQIPPGAFFAVLNGPFCEDSIAWWEVRYRDSQGWTAEGRGDEYYIAPGCPSGGCAYG